MKNDVSANNTNSTSNSAKQESSAKLTNQRISYAFTSSTFSFHACHILPTSKFKHSYFTYFLYQWTARLKTECELIQFTCLTLPLRGTPANNPITLISPVQWGAVFFCRWQSTRSSANFRTVLSESQKHQPRMSSSNQILTQNDNSRSFKVIRFGVNEEPLRGYIVQYNNCGHECEGLEDIASEKIAIYDAPTLIWCLLSSKPPRISI